MKLYHYAPKKNTIMTEGLFGIEKSPKDLISYSHRVVSTDRKEIMNWLDKTFPGRSRSVSFLTEPIVYDGNDIVLKKIVDCSILYSVELERLLKDGLIEAIWCKDGSDKGGLNEKFYQVSAVEIDTSPLAWDKCDSSRDLLFAVIRHYLLVLKDGVIPPEYITKEN